MGQVHVIVGAGPVGTSVAKQLAAQGKAVRVVTRSGSGPKIAGVELVSADASIAAALSGLTADAAAIYNCANPPYHRWTQEWPPIAAALLQAAEASRAVLVTIGNLYGYGPATASLGVAAYDRSHPMTEATPLAATGTKGGVRRRMWQEALALHEAGRIRAVEIRSSDYVGVGTTSAVGDRVIVPLLEGKPATMTGSVDRLHTLTFVDDVARLAGAVADDPRAWGRAWHTPSNDALTLGRFLENLTLRAGVEKPVLRILPYPALYMFGLVSPLLRELRETQYQFRDDFVMDSSDARRTFGLEPTPWATILDTVLAPHLGSGDHGAAEGALAA